MKTRLLALTERANQRLCDSPSPTLDSSSNRIAAVLVGVVFWTDAHLHHDSRLLG